MESLRTEENDRRRSKSWFGRNRILIVASSTIIVLCIIVGIVLAVVLTTSYTEPILKDSRVDCLPWLKGSNNADIEAQCKKLSYCTYDFAKEKNIPGCYYKSDALKVKIGSPSKTELGENYELVYNSLTRAEKRLLLSFEYLDDNTLHFKVC
jgi:hypothetical protein